MSPKKYRIKITPHRIALFWCITTFAALSTANAQPVPPKIVPGVPSYIPAPILEPVPISECSGCTTPGSGGCCLDVVTGCTRTDTGPFITNPGMPRVLAYGDVYCWNCCKFIPDTCLGNMEIPAVRDCNFTATWAISATITYSLSTGLSLDSKLLKLKLLEGVLGGQNNQSLTQAITCSLSARRCKGNKSNAALVIFVGRTVAMNHTWKMTGTTVQNNPPNGPACQPPCALHGKPFPEGVCRTDTSTATGISLGSISCLPVVPADCRDIMPPIPCQP